MIAIYLNTREWGGVDVLVGRLANYLLSRGIEFRIIEPDGKRIRKEFPHAKFINPDQVQTIANQVTHVFVPSVSQLRDSQFPWLDLAHARVITWVVHPNDVFRSFFPYSTASMNIYGYRVVKPLRCIFREHTKLFDTLFSRLVKEKALIVMDGATRRSLKYFVPKLDIELAVVPIPSPSVDAISAHPRNPETLSIGYLGRMDGMKWSAIRPFISHTLAPLAKRRLIAFHIVSEGSHLSRVERLCADSEIEFHSYGYLPNKQAREIIVSRTDLAVAMGTSALDIAGAGHPCLILDPSLGKFAPRQTRFRFVHETDENTLGEYRDFPGYVKSHHDFQEIVDDMQLESIAAQEREYVQQIHDPIRCFDALLNRVYDSTLLVGELKTYIQFLENSFNSVKSRPFFHLVRIVPEQLR